MVWVAGADFEISMSSERMRNVMYICRWGVSRTCVNESCHIRTWMRRVTYVCEWVWMRRVIYVHEWVLSHLWIHAWMRPITYVNELCHVWMSHVTYEWVMSHMNESCHISMSHVTYQWVMSHECVLSRDMNESCHVCDVRDENMQICTWMSHVIHKCEFEQRKWAFEFQCLARDQRRSNPGGSPPPRDGRLNTTTHCNTLQDAVTHCNTLQHTATHCNTLVESCNTLQHTGRKLQHTATHW